MLDPRQVEAAMDPDKIGQIGGMHGVPKRATILWEDMELIHAAARAYLASRSVTDEEVEAAAKALAELWWWDGQEADDPEEWSDAKWDDMTDDEQAVWRSWGRTALAASRSVRQETP